MTWNSNFSVYKQSFRDFLGGPVVKNLPSNAGDEGSIPGRETGIPRAEGLLSSHAMEPETMKDPTAATKTWCGQINKYILLKWSLLA